MYLFLLRVEAIADDGETVDHVPINPAHVVSIRQGLPLQDGTPTALVHLTDMRSVRMPVRLPPNVDPDTVDAQKVVADHLQAAAAEAEMRRETSMIQLRIKTAEAMRPRVVTP